MLPAPRIASPVRQAFVLGAGLGTRLRKLTEQLPKPLVPLIDRPLISYAFDHVIGVGVEQIIVNTHHRAEAYGSAFPEGRYRDVPITFRHEPVLLETGGGLKNIEDLAGDAPLLVYNGDIYATLPLAPAIAHHCASGNEVTLILRSHGDARNVGFASDGTHSDSGSGYPIGSVIDLRHRLGRDPGGFLFTGIYLISPAFFQRLALEKLSVIEPLLAMISAGERVGAIVIDEGEWWDLGTREQLLALHAHLRLAHPAASWVAPDARIAPNALLSGATTIGAGASIGSGARLHDTLVWNGAVIEAGAELSGCIVTGQERISGRHSAVDL